jgi:transcriptional regulator with XRE-family HTH domain
VTDVPGLHAAVDAVRRSRGISWRQVAREAGLYPSVFTRMAAGRKPGADALLAMTAWLGIPAGEFMLDGRETGSERGLLEEMITLLRGRRDLSPADRQYLTEIIAVALRRIGSERDAVLVTAGGWADGG